jgi:Fic family protein
MSAKRIISEIKSLSDEKAINKIKDADELKKRLQSINELSMQLEQLMSGRKDQVLSILQQSGPISIDDIATQLATTNKNISSVLTALRKSNIKIGTNSLGQKFLEK